MSALFGNKATNLLVSPVSENRIEVRETFLNLITEILVLAFRTAGAEFGVQIGNVLVDSLESDFTLLRKDLNELDGSTEKNLIPFFL